MTPTTAYKMPAGMNIGGAINDAIFSVVKGFWYKLPIAHFPFIVWQVLLGLIIFYCFYWVWNNFLR